jgi:hypothetical protein
MLGFLGDYKQFFFKKQQQEKKYVLIDGQTTIMDLLKGNL